MRSDRRMQSRDPFLPEKGHLDGLKFSASLQKVSVHSFQGKTSAILNCRVCTNKVD